MGGFALNEQSFERSCMPSSVQHLTLTPRGVLQLAAINPNIIPDIPKEQIWDKSKANGLAKLLVCLQATWFCVQCIVRLTSAIGISLLELNTFAHAM